jgi:hypothetical protein
MQALNLNAATPLLTQLKKRAEADPVPLARVIELSKATESPDDLNMDKTVMVPFGYVVTYTHEEQPRGLFRHLSVSVKGQKLPSKESVIFVMEVLGFAGGLEDCMVWVENSVAVNVLQPVDGWPQETASP